MKAFAEVLAICGVAREELTLWIERRWVLPLASDGDYIFNDADLARAQMIAEFRRDLALDDDAMMLVLGLVDQLHAARRRLKQLLVAIDALPEEARDVLLRRLDADAAPEK
jgi:chaperone modulatory protein CbpM